MKIVVFLVKVLTIFCYSTQITVKSIPPTNEVIPIKNRNFDIRENNFALHPSIYMGKFEYKETERTCNSNIPLQISSVVSDKIYPRNPKKYVSPMNSLTCLDDNFDCFHDYVELAHLEKDFQELVDIYNTKGGQYFENYPYSFDDQFKFPTCKEFTNEINELTTHTLEIVKYEKEDFEYFKYEIFNKGSMLAAFYAPRGFLSYIYGGIYTPDEGQEKVAYYLLRIIGWRDITTKDKTTQQDVTKYYWIFGFTNDSGWGIGGYGMMEVGVGGFTYYNIEVKEKSS